MHRHYTATREFLLQGEKQYRLLRKIAHSIDEHQINGCGTSGLEQHYKEQRQQYSEIKKLIASKIDRITDEKERNYLIEHYLHHKPDNNIIILNNYTNRFLRLLRDRACMDLEIVLLEDGILTNIDPTVDITSDYEDGYADGYEQGKIDGLGLNAERGYDYSDDDDEM